MEAAITVNEACEHRLNLLAAQSTSPVSARSISPSETAMTKRKVLAEEQHGGEHEDLEQGDAL
eukprot:12891921-Alexandrium_andersonii.AAC.1